MTKSSAFLNFWPSCIIALEVFHKIIGVQQEDNLKVLNVIYGFLFIWRCFVISCLLWKPPMASYANPILDFEIFLENYLNRYIYLQHFQQVKIIFLLMVFICAIVTEILIKSTVKTSDCSFPNSTFTTFLFRKKRLFLNTTIQKALSNTFPGIILFFPSLLIGGLFNNVDVIFFMTVVIDIRNLTIGWGYIVRNIITCWTFGRVGGW